jgi:FHS family glucose/mannose:H+ symporter-like MFS transporter
MKRDPDRLTRSSRTKGRILVAVFSYFVVAGVATVMLGPTLPLLAERWGLPDSRLGTLFFAFFLGQLCGAWFATRRLGASLLLGAGCSAGGFCALAFTGSRGAHLWLFVIGLGLGAGMTVGNVIVGTIDDSDFDQTDERSGGFAETANYPAQASSRSSLLALLNLSWGLGAITCPLWLRLSVWLSHLAAGSMAGETAARSSAVFFLGLGAGFAAIAALIGWLLPRRLYRPVETGGSQPRMEWRILGVFVATMALYVGVENSLAGWLPTYAQRLAAGGPLSGVAAEIALCFWLAELTGRGLTAILVKWVDERIFYRLCLAVLIATVGLLVMLPHPGKGCIFGLTAIAALCLSPIFPLAVAFLLARVGRDPGVGKIFASSSLGGTLLPWITGLGSTWSQSLRLGFVVPAIGAVAILLLSWFLPKSGAALSGADR